jgi:glucose/arabinose dehydrogenase
LEVRERGLEGNQALSATKALAGAAYLDRETSAQGRLAAARKLEHDVEPLEPTSLEAVRRTSRQTKQVLTMSRFFWLMVPAALSAGCPSSDPPAPLPEGGLPDANPPPPDALLPPPDTIHPADYFCDLPGSVRYETTGVALVPGGQTASVPPSISFMKVPANFCVHHYGKVGNPRQMRFAPGGELFVASPTGVTTGGGSGGLSSIVYLPDDNHDGYSDSISIFQSALPQTQGLLFTKTHFYYQDNTRIVRIPYQAGDRAPRDGREIVANITYHQSLLHWPKPLDEADDGTIYVGNGGDQGEPCNPARPMNGGIVRLDGSPGGLPVVKGFRNPIAVRCLRGFNKCFAVELAKDYSAQEGGREKLVPIREGDDWGYPCCATKDVPHQGLSTMPDCSKVVPEDVSFLIGDTPFSFDFEPGKWPEPYRRNAFVPLHGTAGPWLGARLVSVGINPETGDLLPSTTLGGNGGGMRDFVTGWDDKTLMHGRPAAVTFAADGRLFLANDNTGDIVWIAPFDLER